MADPSAAQYLEGRVDALREHLASLAAAAPALPQELARVSDDIAREVGARGTGTLLLLIAGFVGLGYILETALRYATAPQAAGAARWKRWKVFLREAGALAAFTLGSAAAFLAFEWPPRTRGAVMAVLTAFICVRAAIIVSRAVLRTLPMDEHAGRFWHARVVLFAAWLALGWMIAERLRALGMSEPARLLIVYALGLGLLAIGKEALRRRSPAAALALVLVWALWVIGARGFFWLALVALALPPLLRLAQAGTDHTLGGLGGVIAGRALRALLIVGAALLLAAAFGLDVDTLAGSESFWPRLLRGALNALVIVLVADLIWLVCASLIDRKLASADDANRARLQTLLPILRATLGATLVVMVVLMSLSALGVQVGPLLASAGVVGIAIGFGAQQLVRDLFAKFSYLLDDAFRVGEYIESGNYKGTVERLGGRSVQLRHHRGPIFTIPYGQLGAIKNSSRDWVIDKMTIGVAYDTDLDKAKKIIKKIGQELAENEEFAPQILEPLKMQGVEQFGDYAIQLRMKMKTRPNQQFTIRRRAYAMIKKAFAENGIRFAQPTVQVAGGGEASAAAAVARQALEMKKVS